MRLFGPQPTPLAVSLVYSANAYTAVNNTPSILPIDTVTDDDVGMLDAPNNRLILPAWARLVQVMAHVSFPNNVTLNTYGMLQIYRNNLPASPHVYTNRQAYLTGTGNGIILQCQTPWQKVGSVGEYWTAKVRQATGGDVTLLGGTEHWMSVAVLP